MNAFSCHSALDLSLSTLELESLEATDVGGTLVPLALSGCCQSGDPSLRYLFSRPE